MNSEKAWHCSETPEAAYGAATIAHRVMETFPDIASVIDIGCSIGTFLKAFSACGVSTIRGFDAEWVDQKKLVIPASAFTTTDLTAPINANNEVFDLLISLEVAEHLSEERAKSFINELCSLSDLILFSAAIPGQGGVGHINEQWQSYWRDLFATNGFTAYDFIRQAIWNDEEVPVWYRQNIMLYAKKPLNMAPAGPVLDVVHPEQYMGVHFADTTPMTYARSKFDRLRNRFQR